MAKLPKTIDVGRVHLRLQNKIYQARWTQNGERKSRTSGSGTPRGAIAFAERIVTDLEREGEHDVVVSNITIQKAVDKFISEFEGWSPGTMENARYFFSARFLPSFATRRILAIPSRQLSLWLSEQRKRPTWCKDKSTEGSEPLSASAYNGMISYLSAFWKFCVLHGIATDNPVKELKRRREPRYMDVEARVLTEAQVAILLADLSTLTESPHAYLLTALAVDTGMRRGELWALTWDDIDFEKNLIRVYASKTDNWRHLPMTERARELLRARFLTLGRFGSGEGPVPRVNIRKALMAAGKRLGIGHIHFHMLRHTAATRFREAGMDLPVIQRALGHANILMTRRYMATRQNELVEGMKDVDKLNRRLDLVDQIRSRRTPRRLNMEFDELLKQATAHKRKGDLKAAIESIDQAISLCPVSDSGYGMGRGSALRKRIDYLIISGRYDEALESAEKLIVEAEIQAGGFEAIVGTCYSGAYQQRAKVRTAMSQPRDAFEDCIRAIWWWQSAMRLQDREDEHTVARAADRLVEHAEEMSIGLTRERILDRTERGIILATADMMVELFDCND